MRKLALGLAALVAGVLIAFAASQPPPPKAARAPAAHFSAARAMADVREIARAPHPTGSAEHRRVRAYLEARLRQRGLSVSTQSGPLGEPALKRIRDWSGDDAAAPEAVNVIAMLPGRDRAEPALLLMAHYDSVWASPGAADDAAGVAAILEILRAIRREGPPARDVVVLFTDAEELGLDGARLFFERHPLSRRVGAVVNLEARGSGGRASMFEAGRGNGAIIDLYRRVVSRPSANSLAVLIYELMPNNTDFSIPKRQGRAGLNFAFIGASGLYHSPLSTPQALDQGALQDIGDQTLDISRALAFAPALPPSARDAVFGDVLGLFVIAYSPGIGWLILAVAAVLISFSWSRARRVESLDIRAIGGGAALSLALLIHAALLLRLGNLLSGSGPTSNYYDRLAAIPRLEVQAFLLCLAALLLLPLAQRPARALLAAAPALGLSLLAMFVGRFSPWLAGLGIAAAVSAVVLPRAGATLWGGWFGLVAPVFLLALGAQIAAPTAAPILAWPLLLASIAMGAFALLDRGGKRLAALVPVAFIAALGTGQLLYLGHFTFLGIGAPMAEGMAVFVWLMAILAWPLLREAAMPRLFAAGAAVLILSATGIALSVRLDPIAQTVPPYSARR